MKLIAEDTFQKDRSYAHLPKKEYIYSKGGVLDPGQNALDFDFQTRFYLTVFVVPQENLLRRIREEGEALAHFFSHHQQTTYTKLAGEASLFLLALHNNLWCKIFSRKFPSEDRMHQKSVLPSQALDDLA